MRNLDYLEGSRITEKELSYYGQKGDSYNGIFRVYVGGKGYNVIASNGGGWDHISVTPTNTKRGCPTWEVMCDIKKMFFEDDEIVLQYHPAKAEYINIYPCCLHLWRPQHEQIPTPPKYMV